MSPSSKNVKKELVNAMNDENSAMFVIDGKLISLEAHDTPSMNEESNDLAQDIEEYPELKKSQQRFLDNPKMRRYTAEELKESRHDRS